MQDNFNIHNWRLKVAINELEEKTLCKECGEGYMEEGMCMECGYMEEATFTDKHDDNPKLKGGQKDLPDEVQAGILKKEGEDDDSGGGTLKIEKKDNKYYWTWITKSGKSQKSNDGFESKAEAQRDFMRKSKYMKESEGQDHEVSMAQASLKAIISAASQLTNKIGDNERDIPGWIQDHITNAENYIEQANQGFHELKPAIKDIDIDTMDMVAEEVSDNKKTKAKNALAVHLRSAIEEKDKEGIEQVKDAKDKINTAKSVEELYNILGEFGYEDNEISDILGK